jgi:hypothetical protein
MEKVETAQIQHGPDLSHQDAPVSEEDLNEENDVIPSFSKRSSVYDERILYNLLSTIHQEHFTYIGIIATDVEDLVFLAHEIRLTCPDIILFTMQANIRYLTSDANPDLQGMPVFSTYPLFEMTQRWISPFDSPNQIQFQSNASEAEYNAILAYLGAVAHGGEDAAPDSLQERNMLDYATPFTVPNDGGKTSPVLWASVVGHDAIWPLAYHEVDKEFLEDNRLRLIERTAFECTSTSNSSSNAASSSKPLASSTPPTPGSPPCRPDMNGGVLFGPLLWIAIWTSLPISFVCFAASARWISSLAVPIVVVAVI